jgi:hypothetical protein
VGGETGPRAVASARVTSHAPDNTQQGANRSGCYALLLPEPRRVGSMLDIAGSERRIIRPTSLVVCYQIHQFGAP